MSLATIISTGALCLFSQTSQQTPQTNLDKVYPLPLPHGTVYWIDKADEYGVKLNVLFWHDDSVNDVIYTRISDSKNISMIDYGNDGKLDHISIINGKENKVENYPNNRANADLFKKAQEMYVAILKFLEPWTKKPKK